MSDAEPSPDHAIKRLEWLQAIITRMAANSFLIKGWATTVCAALLALAAKDSDRRFALLALYPAVVFWCLDANYLRLERVFRKKYEDLARPLHLGLAATEAPPATFRSAFGAPVTSLIYLTIVAVVVAVALLSQ